MTEHRTEPGEQGPGEQADWLVTGAAGMLGREMLERLSAARARAVGRTRAELDAADPDAVRAALAAVRPRVVVNCAAHTAVDDAESHEEAAHRANAVAPAVLAAECAKAGAALLHVSTDYVFSGADPEPYREDAVPDPRTAYGRTKLAGERAVLEAGGVVVRTAWLYGAHGPNFVRTMLRLERERPTLDVVDDQRGQPTWTAEVAERLYRLGGGVLIGGPRQTGVRHAVADGSATWFELAREVFRLAGADPARVRPTTTAAFPRPAPRPADSVLANTRWAPLRPWREALAEAFPQLLAAERAASSA